MKAVAVFPSKKSMELIDYEEPQISRPTEIKLRILDIGICGTDREIGKFEYGTPPAGSEYLVIGHESLGQVIEAGPQCTHFKSGDYAVTMVRRPCHREDCKACRAGRADFCYTGEFTERGIKGRHGFLTEIVVDDERFMVPMTPQLREVGVLLEPLTIAQKALIELGQIQERLPWECRHTPDSPSNCCHKAAVLGAGPVGLLGAMALRNAGFDTVVYSKEKPPTPQSDLVNSIGAKYISSEETSIDRLEEIAGPIDVVYEATGASKFAFDVLPVIGRNAVFILTGVPGRKSSVELNTDLLMRNIVLKNQVLLGTVNAGRDAYERGVKDLESFIKRWPAAVKSLITGRYQIEQYREVIRRKQGIKDVISIADEDGKER